ncbi:MAG TPA: hypothetical protein ENN39_05025 [Desulfonatronum sp.]|nr:hypothetical protein [Desulfonatronum sp.]
MLKRLVFTVLVLCWATQPAMGHKLLLMAWIQGDQLMGEVAFGDGTFAANAKIAVQDALSRDEILTVHADERGLFESALPMEVLSSGRSLLVRASDGAGHLAEVTIGAEEIAPAGPETTADDPNVSPARSVLEPAHLFDREEIRRLVQETVSQEVAPLRRDVLALARSGPGITEILGGIGYIIGLASLGFWLLRRR